MKELLDSYQQIYVSLCGQQFVNRVFGEQHELYCIKCIALAADLSNDKE